jgi:raffinose/stachyose/melibiose transport system permease protein
MRELFKRRLFAAMRGILLAALLILILLPVYICVANALKPSALVTVSPLSLPVPPVFDSIVNAFTNPNINIGGMYQSSAVLTVSVIALCVLVSSIASYYLARAGTRLSRALRVYFLLGLMVPYIIVYLPLCMMVRQMGIPFGVPLLIFVFVSGNISFATFMYTNYLRTVPAEIEEGAMIDGASRWTIFWRILFPLLKPCTATVCIFVGLGVWNDFLTPMILGQVKTITVGIYTAIGPHSADWSTVFSFVLLATLPMVIAFLSMQKQFISGLVSGAMKG